MPRDAARRRLDAPAFPAVGAPPVPEGVRREAVDAGHGRVLVLRGAAVPHRSLTRPGRGALLTRHGGEDGTALVLPAVAAGADAGPAFAWR